MRKRCILKEDVREGMQLFWYEPCKSGDPEFDVEYVAVFAAAEGGEPFVTLHRSNIIEVPENVASVRKWGQNFPEDAWLKEVRNIWKGES